MPPGRRPSPPSRRPEAISYLYRISICPETAAQSDVRRFLLFPDSSSVRGAPGKHRLSGIAGPALLRHSGPQAGSSDLTVMPKPLPLGEVSPKVTERASPAGKSRCAAMGRLFVRAILSLCQSCLSAALPSQSRRKLLAKAGLRLPASASLSLASCWPLPQQLLPVSATGGGRRRCPKGGALGMSVSFRLDERSTISQKQQCSAV